MFYCTSQTVQNCSQPFHQPPGGTSLALWWLIVLKVKWWNGVFQWILGREEGTELHTHLLSHPYSTTEKCIWRAKDFHLMIIIPVREKFSLALETALVLKLHACVEIYDLLEVGIFWINESMSILSLKYLLNNGDWQSASAERQIRVSAVRLFCCFFSHKFILMCWFGESGSQAWVIYLNTHLPGKSPRGEQKK